MWYTKRMKKKLIFSVVLIMLCVSAFVFAGFGAGGGGVGTLTVTDSNRFVVFTSKAQFEQYHATHTGDLFVVPVAERAQYDEEFFATQALVMFLTDGMSSSIGVQCEGYQWKGSELHVTVKELSPPMHTMDLRHKTLTVAIEQSKASSINKVVLHSYRVESAFIG